MRKNKVLTTVTVVCLVLILSVLSFMGACTEPSSEPATTPATSAPATPETITLDFAFWNPPMPSSVPGYAGVDLKEWWCNEITARTGGRVQAKFYPSQSLCKGTDSLNALQNGIAQVAGFSPETLAGRFPVTDFIGNTPLCNNYRVTEEVMNRLYLEGLLPEFDGYRPIAWYAALPTVLIMKDKKVLQMEDLNGLKIRARGAVLSNTIQSLGATPVALDAPELFMALDRGVIDGMTNNVGAYTVMKLYEVTKYIIDKPLCGGCFFLIMTEDFFQSLPPDIQLTMLQLNADLQSLLLVENAFNEQEGRKVANEGGREMYKLDSAESARWQSVLDTVTEQELAKLNEKGLPGDKIMEVAQLVINHW